MEKIFLDKISLNDCGVYFLFREEEVVYVGSSKNIASRIATHIKTKSFDSYSKIHCNPEDMLDLEFEYIVEYVPIYNLNLPDCNKKHEWLSFRNNNNARIKNGKINHDIFILGNTIYVRAKEELDR